MCLILVLYNQEVFYTFKSQSIVHESLYENGQDILNILKNPLPCKNCDRLRWNMNCGYREKFSGSRKLSGES